VRKEKEILTALRSSFLADAWVESRKQRNQVINNDERYDRNSYQAAVVTNAILFMC